jgi:predicted nuclease of predicted toxin-antitoxin system
MRVLLDECVPRKLKFFFTEAGHECETVTDAGFSGKENGELLALADKEFDVLITVDKNIRRQQKIPSRKISLVVIRALSNDLDDIHSSAHRRCACDAVVDTTRRNYRNRIRYRIEGLN